MNQDKKNVYWNDINIVKKKSIYTQSKNQLTNTDFCCDILPPNQLSNRFLL